MSAIFTPIKNLRWNGLPVQWANLSLYEASHALPRFHRMPFGEGANVNPLFHTIIRQPCGDDERHVPVGVVSPQYALLQHTDMVRTVADAIRGIGKGVSGDDPAFITMTPLGERLECRLAFRDLEFDPGDGHPLKLELLLRNSVDGSCAFEVSLRFMRQICRNGVCVLSAEDRLREIHHRDHLDEERIGDFIRERAAASVDHQWRLREWVKAGVDPVVLGAWLAEDVRAAWGPFAATRVMHVCRRGVDGVPDVPPGRRLPRLEDIPLRDAEPVPGAVAPARSLYAAYQALTWVADHRPSLEDREVWGADALRLLKQLEERMDHVGVV